MRILLGIDPGLQRTGWGIIRQEGNSLSFVACGTIKPPLPPQGGGLSERLHHLSTELTTVVGEYKPAAAAIEETFVSVNGQSTLKLGQARGAILLTLSQANLPIAEYAATLVKKSLTGNGHAEKDQVAHMVRLLLPGCKLHDPDAMDALAIAITHAHHGLTALKGQNITA